MSNDNNNSNDNDDTCTMPEDDRDLMMTDEGVEKNNKNSNNSNNNNKEKQKMNRLPPLSTLSDCKFDSSLGLLTSKFTNLIKSSMAGTIDLKNVIIGTFGKQTTTDMYLL
jgi:hypothetical protein